MDCKIPEYIEKQNYTDVNKQRLANVHIEIFSKLKAFTKYFTSSHNTLRTTKDFAAQASQEIVKINNSYNLDPSSPRIVTLKPSKGRDFYVNVNVLPIATDIIDAHEFNDAVRDDRAKDEYFSENIQNIHAGVDRQLREKYFPQEIVSSQSVLEKIANFKHHPLNRIAQALLPYNVDTQIHLIPSKGLTDELGNTENISAARFWHSSRIIEIAEDASFRGIGSEATLIHEILHALTWQFIREHPNNTEVEKLKDLYEQTIF